MRHLFLISSWGIHLQEATQVLHRVKCAGGDVKVWFVAQSMFLTDHWNLPAQITRWITASLQWDMSDALFCYLSFNRQLIALLSVRCLRSTLHSVTHSLDLIVFLMVEASVARHWRNDASQAVSIFREPVEKASLLPKVEILILLFFSTPSVWFESINVSSYQRVLSGKARGAINISDMCYLFIRITLTLHTIPRTC